MTPTEAKEAREHPILFSGPMVRAILDGRKTQTRRVVTKPERYQRIHDCAHCCPYGAAGGDLWVRETWQEIPDDGGTYVYRATDPDWETTDEWTWKPSIFMPRDASRLTLEITEVRIQRLQDIGEDDAKAEGVCQDADGTYRGGFFVLWESLNAKRGFGWKVNPWVWAVSFKRL